MRLLLLLPLLVAAPAAAQEGGAGRVVDVELTSFDFDPEYHGPEGFKRFVTQWKSGFDYFRYEPREIADAGGAHFAFKVGVFGRFAGSGTELEDEWATVYTMKDGLTYRMVNEYEWETALATLEGRLAGTVG